MSNVSDFLALTGIQSAIDLFPQLSRDTSTFTRKMRKTYRFQERLGTSVSAWQDVPPSVSVPLSDCLCPLVRLQQREFLDRLVLFTSGP